MKEYKILDVKKDQAEKTMNEMVKDGWEVVSVNYWSYWKTALMITFVRER